MATTNGAAASKLPSIVASLLPGADSSSVIDFPQFVSLPDLTVQQGSRDVRPVDPKLLSALGDEYEWLWDWTFAPNTDVFEKRRPLAGYTGLARPVSFVIGRVSELNHGVYELWARNANEQAEELGSHLIMAVRLVVTGRRQVVLLRDDQPLIRHEPDCERWVWISRALTNSMWQRYWTEELRPLLKSYRELLSDKQDDNGRWDFGAWINSRQLDMGQRRCLAALLGMVERTGTSTDWYRFDLAMLELPTQFAEFAASRRAYITGDQWTDMAAASKTLGGDQGSAVTILSDLNSGVLRISANRRRGGLWIAQGALPASPASTDGTQAAVRPVHAVYEVHVVDSLRSMLFLPRSTLAERRRISGIWTLPSAVPLSVMSVEVDQKTGSAQPHSFQLRNEAEIGPAAEGAVRRWYVVPLKISHGDLASAQAYGLEWSQELVVSLIDSANKQNGALWRPVHQGPVFSEQNASRLVPLLFGTALPPAGAFSAMALLCFDETPFSAGVGSLADAVWPRAVGGGAQPVPETAAAAAAAALTMATTADILGSHRSALILDNDPNNDNELDITTMSQARGRFDYVARTPQRELVSVCIIVWNVRADQTTQAPAVAQAQPENEGAFRLPIPDEARMSKLVAMAVRQIRNGELGATLGGQCVRLWTVYRGALRCIDAYRQRVGAATPEQAIDQLFALTAEQLRSEASLYRFRGMQDALYIDRQTKEEWPIAAHSYEHVALFDNDSENSPLASLGTSILWWRYVCESRRSLEAPPEAAPNLATHATMALLEHRSIVELSKMHREADARHLKYQLNDLALSLYEPLAALMPRLPTATAQYLQIALDAVESAYEITMYTRPMAQGYTPPKRHSGWTLVLSFASVTQIIATVLPDIRALAADIGHRFSASAVSIVAPLEEFDTMPIHLFPSHITQQDARRVFHLGQAYKQPLLALCEGSGLPVPPPRELPVFYQLESSRLLGAKLSMATARFYTWLDYHLSPAMRNWWLPNDHVAAGTQERFSTLANPHALADIPTVRNLILALGPVTPGETLSTRRELDRLKKIAIEYDDLMLALKDQSWAEQIKSRTITSIHARWNEIKAIFDSSGKALLLFGITLRPPERLLAKHAGNITNLYTKARKIPTGSAPDLVSLGNRIKLMLESLRRDCKLDRSQLSRTAVAVNHWLKREAMKQAEIARRRAIITRIVGAQPPAEGRYHRLLDELMAQQLPQDLLDQLDLLDDAAMDSLMDDIRGQLSLAVDELIEQLVADPDAARGIADQRFLAVWKQPVATHIFAEPSDESIVALMREPQMEDFFNKIVLPVLRQAIAPKPGGAGALNSIGAPLEPDDEDDRPVPDWPRGLVVSWLPNGIIVPTIKQIRQLIAEQVAASGVSAASAASAATPDNSKDHILLFVALAVASLPLNAFEWGESIELSIWRGDVLEALVKVQALGPAAAVAAVSGPLLEVLIALKAFEHVLPNKLRARYWKLLMALLFLMFRTDANLYDAVSARLRTTHGVSLDLLRPPGKAGDDLAWAKKYLRSLEEAAKSMALNERSAVTKFARDVLEPVGTTANQEYLESDAMESIRDAYRKALTYLLLEDEFSVRSTYTKDIRITALEELSSNMALRNVTAQQRSFFRPDPRESGFLSAAINTFYGNEIDPKRRSTALQNSVWQQRIKSINERIFRTPVSTGDRDLEYASSILTAREQRDLIRTLSAEDLAQSAIRMALGHFEEAGPGSARVVPAGLLSKLLWALLSNAGFLAFRLRHGLEPFSAFDSPFRHMAAAWHVDEQHYDIVQGMEGRHSYRGMTQQLSFTVFAQLIEQYPESVKLLDKIVEKRYSRSQGINNSRELWRVVLFGRQQTPGVYMGNRAGVATYQWTTAAYAELLRFIIELDEQVELAAKRMDIMQGSSDLALKRTLDEDSARLDASQATLDRDKRQLEENRKLSTDQSTLASIASNRSAHETRQQLIDSERIDIQARLSRLGVKPSSVIESVDRAALLHSCFVFILGYLMPPTNLDILFAQTLSESNQVMYDYFRGDLPMYLARTIYDLSTNRRPIDRRWKDTFKRLTSGLLIGPPSRLDQLSMTANYYQPLVEYSPWHGVKYPSTQSFDELVFQPIWAMNHRLLARVERSPSPFSRSNLAAGSALCFVEYKPAEDIRDRSEFESPASAAVRGQMPKINVSPLVGLDLRADPPNRPEGHDGFYNAAANGYDFVPQIEYSFIDWLLNARYFLRPSIAKNNALPFVQSGDWTNSEPDARYPYVSPEWLTTHYCRDIELFPMRNNVLDLLERWLTVGDPTRPKNPLLDIIAKLQDPDRPSAAFTQVGDAVKAITSGGDVQEDQSPSSTTARIVQRDYQMAQLIRRATEASIAAQRLSLSSLSIVYGANAPITAADLDTLAMSTITDRVRLFLLRAPLLGLSKTYVQQAQRVAEGTATFSAFTVETILQELEALARQENQRPSYDEVTKYAASHPEIQYDVAEEVTRNIEHGLALYREYIVHMDVNLRRELDALKRLGDASVDPFNYAPVFGFPDDPPPLESTQATTEPINDNEQQQELPDYLFD